MKLRSFLIYLFILSASFCFAIDIDYASFISLQEVLSFETKKIASIPHSNPCMLSNAYIDRAESLIILENYNAAIDDINNGLHYASFCQNSERDLLTGGIWKACLQPLANKFHAWNKKWKILGVPADPAWD